jgi:hypothetical protein
MMTIFIIVAVVIAIYLFIQVVEKLQYNADVASENSMIASLHAEDEKEMERLAEKHHQPAIAQATVPQYVDVPPMNHPAPQPRRQTQAELDAQLAQHMDMMERIRQQHGQR